MQQGAHGLQQVHGVKGPHQGRAEAPFPQRAHQGAAHAGRPQLQPPDVQLSAGIHQGTAPAALAQAGLQPLDQAGPPGIVAIHHGAPPVFVGRCTSNSTTQQGALKQARLGLEIGLHRRVVVEVVLGEVGEHRPRKSAARHPLLVQGMGAHLHSPNGSPRSHRLGQLGLEQVGKGRGVLGRHAGARPAVHQGAKQGRRPLGRRRQVLNQIGGGGFAIGAGHPDQGHGPARAAPELRRQRPGPLGHRIGQHHHRIPCSRWVGRRRRLTNQGRRRSRRQGLGPEAAPIHLGPG